MWVRAVVARMVRMNILSYRSSNSILSVYSKDSILSVGSVGSILSVASFGSVLSVLSVASFGSVLSIGAIGAVAATGSSVVAAAAVAVGLVVAVVLEVLPGAARGLVAALDVAEAPLDLGGGVGLPVGALGGHLAAGEGLGDAVRA
ncbi:hypothetical protein SAMN05421748_103143 [Paractinoplanes atraurantiacus]|uniref:Uncharacterized protein n=1 Tax=Paractinoplanes atraurantiacus TaxID=1036182 RepID=A0A285H264_9ACTN|nr:hypothetical protein SAMN05421748_103143 [Actinoplanes atraurantiacus]